MFKLIGRLLVVLVFAGWIAKAAAGPITDFVTVGSNQWAQPDDFTSLSWDDIHAVCGSGSCSGNLTSDSATYNMNGWTWADVGAVSGLFNTYLSAAGGTAPGYPLPGAAMEPDSSWGPDILSDFTPTITYDFGAFVEGVTASPFSPAALVVYLAQAHDAINPTDYDNLQTDLLVFPDSRSASIGGWFYRATPLNQVPLPGSIFLLGLGFLGLRISRRTH